MRPAYGSAGGASPPAPDTTRQSGSRVLTPTGVLMPTAAVSGVAAHMRVERDGFGKNRQGLRLGRFEGDAVIDPRQVPGFRLFPIDADVPAADPALNPGTAFAGDFAHQVLVQADPFVAGRHNPCFGSVAQFC